MVRLRNALLASFFLFVCMVVLLGSTGAGQSPAPVSPKSEIIESTEDPLNMILWILVIATGSLLTFMINSFLRVNTEIKKEQKEQARLLDKVDRNQGMLQMDMENSLTFCEQIKHDVKYNTQFRREHLMAHMHCKDCPAYNINERINRKDRGSEK